MWLQSFGFKMLSNWFHYKTVAVCASLVLTTVMGHLFFEAPLNGPILLGCFVVVLSVFGYRDDCDLEDELMRLQAAAGAPPH